MVQKYNCRWLFTFVWIATSSYFLPGQSHPSLKFITEEEHPYFGCLSVQLSPDSADSLAVFTQQPTASTLPLLGKWEQIGNIQYFQARFPFQQGKKYWVKWLDSNRQESIHTFVVPVRQVFESPTLSVIYPSADRWPANQLKFYLQFDQPMREGVALQYIQLLDGQGEVVERPFLEMGQELWDQEYRQLTVWFDPGRIKTGLIPNERYGPPLHPDRVYQLKIKPGFPAKNGKVLEEAVVKTFQTTDKDQTRPNPAQWKLDLPAAGTYQVIQASFPEALDFGLLQTGLWIENERGETVEGSPEIGLEERSWRWRPSSAWEAGLYYLRIDEDLEDLAGNNLQRLFDTFIKEKPDGVELLPTSLMFQVLGEK